MKIKQIIIILFFFFSVIPMTLFGLTNMYYYNIKVAGILENDLENAVSTQITAIENFLAERRTDAAIITHYQIVQELIQAEKNKDSQRIDSLRFFVDDMLSLRADNNRFIESITILDSDFKVLSSSATDAHGEISALKNLDSKYLSQDLKFTPVIETKMEGDRHRVIAAVQEIYDSNHLMGYLVIEMNLSFFEETRASASLFNNGTIYIIDGNDSLIAAGDTISSRDHYVLSMEERADYLRAWQAREPGKRRGVLQYTAKGGHYMSCYSEFNEIDWKIISSINVDQILQKHGTYGTLVLMMLLVLAVLFATVSYFMSRNLGKPVTCMIGKFKEIREKQDFSIRMDVTGKNELSVVSAEINNLLSDIENYVMKEKLIQSQLKSKTERDPLTGLYNKETLEYLTGLELEKAHQQHNQIACLFVDIDDFKNFNTNHGHRGGDMVLKFIAEELTSLIGPLCGRQGGDEFVACIPGVTDTQAVETTANNLLKSLNQGIIFQEGTAPVPVYCSIGIAYSDLSPISCEELFSRADQAMYHIKNQGKNGYMVWNHVPR